MKTTHTKKVQRRFYLFLLCSLLWMIIIFLFSSQTGNDSANVSGGMVELLCQFFSHVPLLGYLKELGILEFLIRKLAHATEYAVLGVLYGLTLLNSKRYLHSWPLIAICASILYASSDEFHQLFVTGRSGSIQDVCIDTLGSTIAIAILWILSHVFQKNT